jgi:hypothetical protein
MGGPRGMRWANHVPPVARWAMVFAVCWSLLLCLIPPPSGFFSLQLVGSGLCVALNGAMFLGSRMDLRGAWMTPIFVAVSVTHVVWVLPAATAMAIVLSAILGSAGAGRDAFVPVSLMGGTGLVFLTMIAIVNRRLWTLVPMLVGLTISVAIIAIGGGRLLETRLFGVSVAALHLGIAGSLLAGVLEVRARAARIESGHCAACGYDASDVYTGPCPECGKYRDEINDGLL